MIVAVLSYLFVANAVLLVILVLAQQTKNSMGLGSMGGGTQMLFGGSGGQSFLQKLTWSLGGILMILSLCLALLKTKNSQYSSFLEAPKVAQSSSPEQKAASQNPVKNSSDSQA